MRWLISNIRTILLAFILALVVWVSAVTASDPDLTNDYPQAIKVELAGQDPALVIVPNNEATTRITIKAPQSVWDELLRNPDSVRAVADLSGLSAGEHEIPIQIQINGRPAKLVAAEPSTLSLNLEPLQTETLKVTLNITGEPPTGYELGTNLLDPAQVVVSGPQSVVERVKTVRTTLNAGNSRQDIDTTLTLSALDENGRAVQGVTLFPETIHVVQRVIQLGGYRDLAIKVAVTGQVASGYRLSGIVVNPPVITVYSATPGLVEGLPGYVETEPLVLNGAKENIEKRLALSLPQNITVVGDPTVLVQAAITPIVSSITISDKTVELIGLGPGLGAGISPQTVDVILSGPLPVLDTLTPNDVRVVIDLTGLAEGTHQVEPKVELIIQGITVESINPSKIEVILAKGIPLTPVQKP